MILHAVSIAAFFVDQFVQGPVHIQCVQQSAASPEWKWWMSALAPWVGPLLSGVVSIYVAWRVFHWQGEKDRKQWIRDQKKADWSRLLESVANLYRIVPLGKVVNRETAEGLKNELKPAIRGLYVALANCIFLDEFRPNSEKWKKIDDFGRSANFTSNKISLMLERIDSANEKRTSFESDELREESVNSMVDEGFKFAGESSDLLLWLQDEAAKDLMS